MHLPEKDCAGILEIGMGLDKCKKCECMRNTLEFLGKGKHGKEIGKFLKMLKPAEYDCLGCSYCYPTEAIKGLNADAVR
jgi:hypothetical protein